MNTKLQRPDKKIGVMSDNTKACRIKPKNLKREVGNEIFKYCPKSQEYVKDLEFSETLHICSVLHLFNYRIIVFDIYFLKVI